MEKTFFVGPSQIRTISSCLYRLYPQHPTFLLQLQILLLILHTCVCVCLNCLCTHVIVFTSITIINTCIFSLKNKSYLYVQYPPDLGRNILVLSVTHILISAHQSALPTSHKTHGSFSLLEPEKYRKKSAADQN